MNARLAPLWWNRHERRLLLTKPAAAWTAALSAAENPMTATNRLPSGEFGCESQLASANLGARIGLNEMCFFRSASDPATRAIRRLQIDSYLGQLPMAVTINLINAAIIAISLSGRSLRPDVIIWFVGLLILSCARLAAARWRGHAANQAQDERAWAFALSVFSIVLAAFWVIPLTTWFPTMEFHQQLIIIGVMLGMMSGGAVVLSALPPAAIAYIVIYAFGAAAIAAELDKPALAILSLSFGAALCCVAIWNAQQFISHLRLRFELQEQASLISLLRDFGTSGSDWLWELDADLRLRHLSSRFVLKQGIRPESLIGQSVLRLLDPAGTMQIRSNGMKELAQHLACGRPFQDLAVLSADGERWWAFSGKPILTPDGALVGWQGVGSDVTDSRLKGKSSFAAARRDPLTGLGSRLLLREQLEQSLLRRRPRLGMLLLDLDRFKLVNDTLGHSIGDELLCQVGQRLEKISGEGCQVARLGGDEFAIINCKSSDKDELNSLAASLIAGVAQPFRLAGHELNIGATIGIARGGVDGASPEVLIANADLALYSAKEKGRGTFGFFDRAMAERARSARELESHVRAAVRDGGFTIAYQPIVDAQTLEIVCREALLRWTDASLSHIPPSVFVPLLEDAGLIAQVGNQVLKQACREAACWSDGSRVAVNLSVLQFATGELVESVAAAIFESGIEARRLELEVTESVFMREDEPTLRELIALHEMGVPLALDDFGRGYSSFGYLQRSPFDKIKIDQSFVQGAAAGERHSVALVRGMIALARELGMSTTAEGIETFDQAELMRSLGCTELQGYAFGRPAACQGTQFGQTA